MQTSGGARRRLQIREDSMSTSTVNISAAAVKDLRDKTGAPMMDCKTRFDRSEGRYRAGDRSAAQDAACPLPRRKRPALPAKVRLPATSMRAARSAYWLRSTARATSLLALTTSKNWCTTSPCTSRLAIRNTSARKMSLREAFEREKDIYRAQAAATGKPAPVIEKIVEGKMSKFYEEVCLSSSPSSRTRPSRCRS